MAANDEYLETEVMTAPPHKLHLMVVDTAIRHARCAEEALEKRDFETSYMALNHSRDCMIELIAGLDRDRAPDLVDRLKSLFVFAHRRLMEADLKHDPQRARDAREVLELHRDTWLQLVERLRSEPVAADGDSTGTSWMT